MHHTKHAMAGGIPLAFLISNYTNVKFLINKQFTILNEQRW